MSRMWVAWSLGEPERILLQPVARRGAVLAGADQPR